MENSYTQVCQNNNYGIFFLKFFLKNLFLIGGQLLYNVVLVSAIQHCESATKIHMSPVS